MLKIKDASGETMAVLQDEDSSPELAKKMKKKTTEEVVEEGEQENGNSDNVNV